MGQEHHNTKGRKWKQLSEKERYKIEALAKIGLSATEIGRKLDPQRDRRTIERELKLGEVEQQRLNPSNSKDVSQPMYLVEKVYCADVADRRRREKAANKGRKLKIGSDHKLAKYIEDKIINESWAPDVVIGRIKAQGRSFDTSICTKTLYSYIEKGVFAGISNQNLLIKKNKKKRNYKHIRTVALNNKKGKSITQRPAEANDRSEQGHWEIDLVVGKQGTKRVILTLVERKTRKSLYVLVKNKTQKEVILAIKRARKRVGGNFDDVFRSITADNGGEFLDSDGIKQAANCDEVYYAHPYSSWERGSNENGNRILRRFVPKGINLRTLTTKKLQKIEDWVNNYPRKILGYKTANELFL